METYHKVCGEGRHQSFRAAEEGGEGERLGHPGKEEADKRRLVLEEAKKVILEEDESLPKPIKIRLSDKDPSIVKL